MRKDQTSNLGGPSIFNPFAYKDILVHLDGTLEDEVRLAHAEWLAAQSSAHVTGIFTNLLPAFTAFPGEPGTAVLVEFEEGVRRFGEAAYQKLSARFSRLGMTNEVRKIEDALPTLSRRVVTEARWADLFVMSCPYRSEATRRWDQTIEAVLFEGGRGLYLVPQGATPRAAVRTVLIGWSDTRETARAICEALPLIKAATYVEIAHVQDSKHDKDQNAEALSDIAAHLDRHGAKVTVNVLAASGKTSSEMMLDEARRVSADLIVTGAYGHSRLREWLLGGMTYELLSASNIPLVMAH